MQLVNKTTVDNKNITTIDLTDNELHIILKAMEAYSLKTWGYETHGKEGFVHNADKLYSELLDL